MINPLHVFDLDGTVIDSFKRLEPCFKPNGDLDLDKYRALSCTHEAIKTDTLLPLYSKMIALINSGADVAICTARCMSKSDYFYLRKIGLKRVRFIASRDRLAKHFGHEAPTIYQMKDADYKAKWLDLLHGMYRDRQFIVYDDHDGVLDMAARQGCRTVDAKQYNSMAKAYFSMGFDLGQNSELLEAFLEAI